MWMGIGAICSMLIAMLELVSFRNWELELLPFLLFRIHVPGIALWDILYDRSFLYDLK